VQSTLGHANVATTSGYLHARPKMAATTMRRTKRHVLLVMVKNSCSALPGSGRQGA